MVYNKEAIYRYKENNPEQFKISTRQASLKYRQNNLESCREKQLSYKNARNHFIREWDSFRKIDLF